MKPCAIVVDDDPAACTYYVNLLTGMGFEVIEAHDGAAALEHLTRRVPQVVVLDILLPKIDGTSILDYIYSEAVFAATRVLIISAHPNFRHANMRAIDSFLVKPVSTQQFRAALQAS